MLINADFKGLEIVTAAELSRDEVLCQELILGEDIHSNNQNAFKLPSRLIAKVLKFRILYGGSAWSFANDPDFTSVSRSEKYWQEVIDNYYIKYKGIKSWHDSLLMTVMRTGYIEIPSGRYFPYKKDGYRWPLTTIKNYAVQGMGADLVKLARIDFYNKLIDSGLEGLFVGTIHDSLVVDTPEKNVYNISRMLKDSIESVPKLCKEHWDYDFNLPLTCEIMVGKNKKDMEEIVV